MNCWWLTLGQRTIEVRPADYHNSAYSHSPSILDLAWLAGLIEGEGYLSLKSRAVPCITIAMADEDIIARAAALLGAKWYAMRRRKSDKPHYKTIFRCQRAGASAAGWMMTLYQFFGRRRRMKIREILAGFRNRRKGERFRTHCPRNHLLATERGPNGRSRSCRTCELVAGVKRNSQRRSAQRRDIVTRELFVG